MTFVFPILLGGLALAGIPILLHLILRQKPKTLPFPAFRFLVQKHRSNLRKLQLRHLLLLTLRILLIAALCLALARPKLFHESLNISSDRPVAAILAFDTSASMDYRATDNVSRLDEAKKRGLELLDEFPDGSRVLILDTSETPLSDKGEWLTSIPQARKKINELKIDPAAGAVPRAVEQALRQFALLARSTEDERASRLPRLLCVFSDNTTASWPGDRKAALIQEIDQLPATVEGLQQLRTTLTPLVDGLKSLRQELPPPAGMDYPEQSLLESINALAERAGTLQPEDLRNETLHQQVRQARTQTRELLTTLAKVTDKPFEPESFGARLTVNLQQLQRQLAGLQALALDVGIEQPVDVGILRIDFPPEPGGGRRQLFAADDMFVLQVVLQAVGKDVGAALEWTVGNETHRKSVDLPAGQRVATPLEIDLEKLKLGVGAQVLEVKLTTKDSWEDNNQRFAAFQVRTPKRVLVVADTKEKAGRFLFGLKLLDYAAEVATPAAAPDLSKHDAVYLFGLASPDAALWKSVDAYVHKGGGVAIIPGGEEMKTAAYETPTAKAILPATWKQAVTNEVPKEAKNEVSKGETQPPGAMWNLQPEGIYQHSMLRPFRAWRDNPSIDFIASPTWAERFWLVDNANNALALVSYAEKGDPPAILERVGFSGKVIQLTTPLDDRKPRWNNYPEKSFYLTLTWVMTKYLTGEDQAARLNFETGVETPRVALPAAPRYPIYNLRGHELFEALPAPEGADLKLKQARMPGNYEVEGVPAEGQKGTTVARFSVNLPAAECDLTRVPAADIESVLGADAVVSADRRLSIREMLAGHWSEPLELFPYLMVLLLFVLALENLLANKFYRREDV